MVKLFLLMISVLSFQFVLGQESNRNSTLKSDLDRTSGQNNQDNLVWTNYYPFGNKRYVVAIKQNGADSISTIYFLQRIANSTKTLWKERIVINQKKNTVNYEDFNGDGIKDLLVFSTTGARGSNEFYYLYLSDPKAKKLIKVKNFENIVNPQYDKLHQLVVSYGYAGSNSYSLYKITADYQVVQIGESFEDEFDSDADLLNQRIEKVLRLNRH